MNEYNVEQILQAKRVARNAGYSVELPDNKIDIAKNIAKAAGYTIKEPTAAPAAPRPSRGTNNDSIRQAMDVVMNAGFSVTKAKTAAPKPEPVKPVAPAVPSKPAVPDVKPEPPKPAPKPADEYGWAETQAAKYL